MKWSDFKKKYPNYSRYRFSEDDAGNVQFLFNGDFFDPFNSDGTLKLILYHFYFDKYPPENIKDFLDTNDKNTYEKELHSGFPDKYKLNSTVKYNFLAWEKNPKELNYHSFDIYITPKDKTQFTFRNIFDDSKLNLNESNVKKWFENPSFTFWAQALNFAVWCATGGCGVSKEMLTDNQVGSFYKFHVYFTIRRILNELQCPLPKDKYYSRLNNYYNKNSYEKLKTEFSTGNDFRFWGTRDVFFLGVYWNSVDYGSYQYEWFFPSTSTGLTNAGLSRINQSVEAFVYCILGSQVQTRTKIIGDSGGAEETKEVFLQLFESAVVESDISKSIQRYQFALQNAKQKLDLAVAQNCWLLPSYLILNTSPIAGYNNKLQKATENMKLGVNDINKEIIPVVKHNLGSAKKNLLPSLSPPPPTKKEKPIATKVSQKHEDNKATLIIILAGVAFYLFK
jgi:hypothetical protein